MKRSERPLGVVVMGSTGSVGLNTLKVIDHHPERFRVVGLAAYQNSELLAAQVRRYRPVGSALFDPMKLRVNGNYGVPCWTGVDGLCRLASLPEANVVVAALSGTVGILPTYEAIRRRKRIALAHKETLVAAVSRSMSASAP